MSTKGQWVLCPECDKPVEAESTHNGVCTVLHIVHCGWGHQFGPDEGFATRELATAESVKGQRRPKEEYEYALERDV